MIGEFFIIKYRILKLVGLNFSDKGEKILDIGCGDKPRYHKKISGKLVCFDIRKTKISHVVGNASSLPFKDNVFDGVISINSFYYFNNPFESAKEVSRVLKKNGIFFLITPFIYPTHDAPIDKYRFTEYGINILLRDSFIIKEVLPIGGIFNLPAVILHSLIKGARFIMPKSFKFISIPIIILIYPFYIATQIFSLLDFIATSRRWATHYFVLAVKK